MNTYKMTEYEQKVDVVLEALRTATGKIVFDAFSLAPTENLIDMQNMIEHILNDRATPECHCNEEKH